MTMKTITVQNQPGDAAHSGRMFTARYVAAGDTYNRDATAVADAPMVEFYDATYADDPRFEFGGLRIGQFVSRYFVDTLLPAAVGRVSRDGYGVPPAQGLDLDFGIDVWKVDGPAIREVMEWLRVITDEPDTYDDRYPEVPDEADLVPIVEAEADPGPHPERRTGDDEIEYADEYTEDV
jgi:hypothetical protein